MDIFAKERNKTITELFIFLFDLSKPSIRNNKRQQKSTVGKKKEKEGEERGLWRGGPKYLYVNEQHTIPGTVWLFFFFGEK